MKKVIVTLSDIAHLNSFSSKDIIQEVESGKIIDKASIQCWFDGSSGYGNVPCFGYGFFIRDKGKIIRKESKCVINRGKIGSPLSAEYAGFIGALRFMLKRGWQDRKIYVYTDNTTLAGQMGKNWRASNGYYKVYYSDAKRLWKKFKNATIHRIARGDNSVADELSKRWLNKKRYASISTVQ